MPNVAPAAVAPNVPIKSIEAPATNAAVKPNATIKNAAANPTATIKNAAANQTATIKNAAANSNGEDPTTLATAKPNATNKNAIANSSGEDPKTNAAANKNASAEDPAAATKAFEEDVTKMLKTYEVSDDKLKRATEIGVYLKALRYQQLIEENIQGKSEIHAKLEIAASGSEKPPESVSAPPPETETQSTNAEAELGTFITDTHNVGKFKAFVTQIAYEGSIEVDKKTLTAAKDAVAEATPKVPVETAAPVNPGAAEGGGRRKRRTHRKKSKKSKKTSRRRRSKVPRSA